jgi:hypothetical protein
MLPFSAALICPVVVMIMILCDINIYFYPSDLNSYIIKEKLLACHLIICSNGII